MSLHNSQEQFLLLVIRHPSSMIPNAIRKGLGFCWRGSERFKPLYLRHRGRRVVQLVPHYDFFHEHPDLAALRDKNYVLMKLNMSRENENRAFLSRYPKIRGYPHIFILDAEGKLMKSQATNELEDGRSYDLTNFRKFVEKYAPKPGA